MKPVKKTKQDSSDRVTDTPASSDRVTDTSTTDEVEEEVVPSGAALVGILLTGLLYFALPPNVIIGPNWLLLVVEAVFVVPLIIDVLTVWDLSHTARRTLVLIPLGISTLALV